jgi:hypothetical protein
LDGFGESADLVNLEQQGIAGLGLDGSLDADGVCHGQVVTKVGQYSSQAH